MEKYQLKGDEMPVMTEASQTILLKILNQMYDNLPLHRKIVRFDSEIDSDQLIEASKWLGIMMAEHPPNFEVEIDPSKRQAIIIDRSVDARPQRKHAPTTRITGATRNGW